MSMEDKVKEILAEQGQEYLERNRTILKVTCPKCGQRDKFSILKENGYCICYRGSCQFKGDIADWLAETAGISLGAALKRVKGEGQMRDHGIALDLSDKPVQNTILPIAWPPEGTISIDSPYDQTGALYLQGRGISVEHAKSLGLVYWPARRRVVIPVLRKGVCVGYQARAVDPVDERNRMRNNDDFRRDSLLMFEDGVSRGKPIVLCEGPFDAMKFQLVGGAVATMGKVVTEQQVKIVQSKAPSRVYLALDDDAEAEMIALAHKFAVPVYRVNVPESAKTRCLLKGKKADFGECTPEECVEAIAKAELVDETTLMISLD